MGHLRLSASSIRSERKEGVWPGAPSPHTAPLVVSGKWNSKLASHQPVMGSNRHPGIASQRLNCFVKPQSPNLLTLFLKCFWNSTLLSRDFVRLMCYAHSILMYKCGTCCRAHGDGEEWWGELFGGVKFSETNMHCDLPTVMMPCKLR